MRALKPGKHGSPLHPVQCSNQSICRAQVLPSGLMQCLQRNAAFRNSLAHFEHPCQTEDPLVRKDNRARSDSERFQSEHHEFRRSGTVDDGCQGFAGVSREAPRRVWWISIHQVFWRPGIGGFGNERGGAYIMQTQVVKTATKK